jgi:hypothetical protein
MAAQMEVNQASDNSVTGHSAGDTPNDGTGKPLELRITCATTDTKLYHCRSSVNRPMARTIQRRAQITIQQSTELDPCDQ